MDENQNMNNGQQTTEESDSVIEKEAKKRGSFCKKIGKDAYEILGIEDKHIAFS